MTRSSTSLATAASLALLVIAPGCSEAPSSGATAVTASSDGSAPAARRVVLHFDVAGMSCDACASTVDATLREVAGVVDCEATFESAENSPVAVTVSDASLAAAVESAIDDLGYEAARADEPAG